MLLPRDPLTIERQDESEGMEKYSTQTKKQKAGLSNIYT